MASGAEINGQMLHNVHEKKLLEHQKEEAPANVHHLDESATTQFAWHGCFPHGVNRENVSRNEEAVRSPDVRTPLPRSLWASPGQ